MAKGKHKGMILSWAFLLGFVLSIVFGIFGTINPSMVWLFAIIGIVIGILSFTEKDLTPFLFSGVSIVIVGAFGQSLFSTIPSLSRILLFLIALFVPATLIVAVKNVCAMTKN